MDDAVFRILANIPIITNGSKQQKNFIAPYRKRPLLFLATPVNTFFFKKNHSPRGSLDLFESAFSLGLYPKKNPVLHQLLCNLVFNWKKASNCQHAGIGCAQCISPLSKKHRVQIPNNKIKAVPRSLSQILVNVVRDLLRTSQKAQKAKNKKKKSKPL